MRRDDRRRRDHGRRGPRPGTRPLVEGLEGRLLLYAATGGSWPHPNLVTYSFVPDGTNVAGAGSNLFQTLNARWSTAAWEAVFTEAAAIWEQVANVNLVQVSDNGTPVGGGPFEQGDPGMGDIRISGLPSSVIGSGTLGYTLLPPPINGSSAAGDIIMNTSQPWQMNSDYDLLTVAIHEFGHALGLGESQIQTAAMYGTYTTIKQSLAPDDVAGIDSIYGARQADAFMANYGNTSFFAAADLTPFMNSQGQFGYPALDLQNANQSEWFKVTVPANSNGSVTFTMQSAGLSLLSPGVAIYNSSATFLGYGGSFNSGSSTATVKLTGIAPGQVYYIQTFGYGYDWNSAGNYGLQVNFSSRPLYPFASPVTTTIAQPNQGGGGQLETTGHGTAPNAAWVHQAEQANGTGPSLLQYLEAILSSLIPLVAPNVSSGSTVTISAVTPAGPLKPTWPWSMGATLPSPN